MKKWIEITCYLFFGGIGGVYSGLGGSKGNVVIHEKIFTDKKTGNYIKIGNLGEKDFGVGIYRHDGKILGCFGLFGEEGKPGLLIKGNNGWEVVLGIDDKNRKGIWIKKGGKKRVFLGSLGEKRTELNLYGFDGKLCGFLRASYLKKKGGICFGNFDPSGKIMSGIEIGSILGKRAYMRILGKSGGKVQIVSEIDKDSKVEIFGGEGGGYIKMAAGDKGSEIDLCPVFGSPGVKLVSRREGWGSGLQIFDLKGKERIKIGALSSMNSCNIILYNNNGKIVWSALPRNRKE